MLESKNSNINLDFANNGKELLAKMKYAIPDLILLDVMMPVMDGPSVLKEIRKNPEFKNIPVIFLTSKAQPSEIEELENMDVLGVIPKPFNTMQLYETIENLLDKYYTVMS